MALPSIAAICDFEIPQTNVVISEEDTHSTITFVMYEKTLPKVLNISDFLHLKRISIVSNLFDISDHSAHLSPFITIFSPPPEV